MPAWEDGGISGPQIAAGSEWVRTDVPYPTGTYAPNGVVVTVTGREGGGTGICHEWPGSPKGLVCGRDAFLRMYRARKPEPEEGAGDYETKVNVGDRWVRKDGVSDETAEFGPPAGTPIEITESVNDLGFGFTWEGYDGPATMGRFHLLWNYRRIGTTEEVP